MAREKLKFELSMRRKDLIVILLSVLVLISVFSAFNLSNAITNKNTKISSLKEESRPANIQLTKIIDSSCTNCFDIEKMVSFIEKGNVNVTKVESFEFSSAKGSQLIKQFNIQKIPALLVSGEITKSSIANIWTQLGGVQKDQTIYIGSVPPYRNVSFGTVEGLVTLTMITDNSCSNCYNVSVHKQILPAYGVFVASEATYDINSTVGKQLLSTYNITKVPTIILSKEANVYSALKQIWSQVGSIETDGQFIFRAVDQMGNYTNLTK